MKLSLLPASLFGLVALTSANPVQNRAFDVGLTFHGVDGSTYGETFPTDASQVQINNPTVVKSIYSNGGGFCTIIGVDGSNVVITGEGDYPVNPPQAQKLGTCDNL